MTTETELTNQQVKDEIIKIRNHFGFTAKQICNLMSMNHQTFRNNCSNMNPTNNFKHSDLFRLKSEIDKMLKIYNHDNNKTTTHLRRPFAHHALSN